MAQEAPGAGSRCRDPATSLWECSCRNDSAPRAAAQAQLPLLLSLLLSLAKAGSGSLLWAGPSGEW